MTIDQNVSKAEQDLEPDDKRDYQIIYGTPLMGMSAVVKSIKRHYKKELPSFFGRREAEYWATNQVLPTVIRYEHIHKRIYI